MNLPPFSSGNRFWKGNLHGHSDHSDGAQPASEVARTYAQLGYDFTCISDHLWHSGGFAASTVFDPNGVDSHGLLLIPSAEMHCRGKLHDDHGLWHIVANGLPVDFPCADDQETAPQLIARAKEAGAFVALAHPEWYCMTMQEALTCAHADAIEVYNHSCHIECDRGSGIAVADFMLNMGHRLNFTATDDSHLRIRDAGGGWVMVAASELSEQAILASLKAGHYYSSTGPGILDVRLEGRELWVECSPASNIIVASAGYLSASEQGEGLTSARIDLGDFTADYFRIAVHDAERGRAWTNPYWFDQLG